MLEEYWRWEKGLYHAAVGFDLASNWLPASSLTDLPASSPPTVRVSWKQEGEVGVAVDSYF